MTVRPPGHAAVALFATALLAATGVAVAAPAGLGSTITKTRWGHTPRGDTRVVFELDEAVEWTVNADPAGMMFEVRLVGADPPDGDGSMAISDQRVDSVMLRPDESGTVALITSSGQPLRVKSFELKDPPRVVLDLGPREPAAPAAPKPAVAAAEPKPATPKPAVAAAAAKPATPKSTAPTPAPPTPAALPAPTPAPPVAAAPTPRHDREDFDDLMAWLHELDGRVQDLSESRTEREQARGRRSLAYFLADRGITREAERALEASLASSEHERSTAGADSLFLAELRVEIGDSGGALAIADRLADEPSAAPDRLRLAKVYSACRRSEAARNLLQKAIADLRDAERAEGLLLLAQCHWDERDPKAALPILETLTGAEPADPAVRRRVLVLEADCLWALDRTKEARLRYERAARLELPADEASWVMLQLGNVARREGRLADAKHHYRTAMERWPETPYASQAGWFLSVVEEIESAQQRAEVAADRG